jgi:hypothetical protein
VDEEAPAWDEAARWIAPGPVGGGNRGRPVDDDPSPACVDERAGARPRAGGPASVRLSPRPAGGVGCAGVVGRGVCGFGFDRMGPVMDAAPGRPP